MSTQCNNVVGTERITRQKCTLNRHYCVWTSATNREFVVESYVILIVITQEVAWVLNFDPVI